jgi:hypothetical protein
MNPSNQTEDFLIHGLTNGPLSSDPQAEYEKALRVLVEQAQLSPRDTLHGKAVSREQDWLDRELARHSGKGR